MLAECSHTDGESDSCKTKTLVASCCIQLTQQQSVTKQQLICSFLDDHMESESYNKHAAVMLAHKPALY